MKKLNITKEQFEKSKYFNKKYGKLEFVSESGKLFKTEKGKVLKFKESNTAKKPIKMVKEGLFSDLGDELDSGISKVRKFFHGKPKFKEGDCVMLCMVEWSPCGISHGNIVSKVRWEDKKWYYEFEDGEPGDAWPEDALAIDPDPKGGYEKGDIRTLLKKYPEFIKRAKTIFNKSKWKEYGVIDESKGFKESCDEKEDIFESNHTELIPREKRKSSEKFNRFFKKLYAMNNGDDGEHTDRATRMEHPYDNVSVIFVDMLELGHEDEPEVVPHLRKVRSYIIKTAEENGWHWTYERFGMSIEFIITEDLDEEQLDESSTEYDESEMPLKEDQETGTMVKVNDLVSKAYASLYDELKKAGIDFDAASDDGFYVNDPDAQKTYFINLYVNECEEYEGSYK